MSTCVFIQIRCKPGKTYQVAEDIVLRELHSELYSTSGDYDMILKMYISKIDLTNLKLKREAKSFFLGAEMLCDS